MQTLKDNLIQKIKQYNKSYRDGNPLISDKEYDKLIEQLKEIDPENDWFKNIEPTSVSRNRKVKLPIPMKSLDKVKNIQGIQSWLQSLSLNENESVVIMPKFDGLALLYSIEQQKAYSRGGSENEGQDCTPHYQMLRNREKHRPKWNCVFGEFVFNKYQWALHFANQISPETGSKYKSPRNTAAGLLNRDTPSELIKHVDFYKYGIDSDSLDNFNSYHDLLINLALEYDQRTMCCVTPANKITEEKLLELYHVYSQHYYIDGLVIYINNLNIWKQVGRHKTTGNPLYAIAYKHPDFTECFETTVKDVIWKVSKSGALKPVVNIEAVDTGDCNMENPTGYNAAWIRDHEIAAGAQVFVTRSGGVIPKMLSVICPATQDSMAEMWDRLCECPHCGAPTAWNNNMVELCCTNKSCNGIQLAKMVFFYTTCGAENIGEETLSKIFNAGFTTIPSLLNINFDELLGIEGFGESIANNILETNKKILNGVDVLTLMHASDCFQGIGKIKAEKILENMDADTLKAFYNMEYVPLKKTDAAYMDLPKTLQSFEDGVHSFYRFVTETQIPIIALSKQTVNPNGKYAGMNICFSGIRDSELEKSIIAEGGAIVSGVSKKTTHLIVKDPHATSSKITKAKELGITIIAIDIFKKS